MIVAEAVGSYRAEVSGAGTLVMAPVGEGVGRSRLLCFGYDGEAVPSSVHDPRVERLAASGDWRLICREGSFDFRARGVEAHQALPTFFDAMLGEYALRSRDKAVVRWLLRLLRLPGGAKLLQAWHARRAQ
jgi:hypothetical protein